MSRRWKKNLERGKRARAAAELNAWRASLSLVLDACSEVLHRIEPDADIGVTLDRVDRELMRFRDHATDVRSRLRRESPELAETVRRATDNTFHLRNHTHAYLLRWKSRQLQTSSGAPYGGQSLREMEEAHLRASEMARLLRSELAEASPEIQRLTDAWEGEG